MSRRGQQLGSVLHRATQSVINAGLSDPRLDAMITVTKVRVTDDKRTAVIHVSVVPEKRQHLALRGLADAARHVRRRVAELVSIHRMPEFVFKLDTSLKKQAAVLDALAQVEAERCARETAEDETAPITEETPPRGDDQP